MTESQSVDVIRQAALRELVRLNGVQSNDGLRHDATVPVTTVTFFAYVFQYNESIVTLTMTCSSRKLTAVVVVHANVVADHVSHCSGHQVRLVGVDVDAETDGSGRAHCSWNGHTRYATREAFAPSKREREREK